MIVTHEHYGYTVEKSSLDLSDYQKYLLQRKNIIKKFTRSDNNHETCFNLRYDDDQELYRLTTSYIIGVNWILEGKLPIYIKPKLNNDSSEIDHLLMFFEALRETENIYHLENLYNINFKAPFIEIDQKQDLLSPILILEFLHILKILVRKGLKKSYYQTVKNLNTRVKGKVLINESVKFNHTKNKFHYNYCKFQEFGYNSLENRLLKKALLFAKSFIFNHKSLKSDSIKELFNYISPSFSKISSEVELKELKNLKHNPFFQEYKQAIKISKLILKRFSYNISETSNVKYKTPPFWIDMPKLFELYLFKKLKEVFPYKNEVIYHKKYNSLEPDIILNSHNEEFKVIVDAKYKPHYENGSISHDDAAQVSGYGRLKSLRKELTNKNDLTLLDTLIIYTSNASDNNYNIQKENLLANEDNRYKRLYKYSISLPYIK